MRFQVYDKKEKEKFNKFLKEKYDFEVKGQIIKQSSDKLRIFTGNLSEHELNILAGTVRVETIGLYLATIDEENPDIVRFSFDASFLGKNSKKNLIELDDDQVKKWFQGQDIEISNLKSEYPFVFLKYKNELVGCGKLTENKILNFVPKERRIKF